MENKFDEMGSELSPSEYFRQIKEKKHSMTGERLTKIYDNCMELANKYYATGQIRGLRKILFCMKSIEKEQKLIELGITTFIYRDDIDFYIDKVASKRSDYKVRPVKNIELERYEREIPDEVVDIITKTKDIFDQMYIVYTDYTGKEERKIKAIEKDPILFGTFIDRENRVCIDRFYYLADWEDEFCNLTLDKMVNETSKCGRNIVRTLKSPSDIDDLRTYLNAHYELDKGSFSEYKIKADRDIKETSPFFFKKVKTVFHHFFGKA